MKNPLVAELNEDRDAIVASGKFSELRPNLTVSNSGPSQSLLDQHNMVLVEERPTSFDRSTEQLTITAPTLSATGQNATAVGYSVTTLPADTRKEIQRNRIIKAIKALWVSKYAEGFNYNSKNYQIDDSSQVLMTAVKTQLADGVIDPHGGRWRATDNTWTTMDDTEVGTFIDAVAVYVKDVRARAWDLIDQVAAATTLSALDGIEADITNGWPAN
jgi:hypothetical protein